MANKTYVGNLGNVTYDDTKYQLVTDNEGEYFHYIGSDTTNIVPPKGLTNYTGLYMGTNIEEPVTIPEGVVSTNGMYSGCQNLVKGSVVPDTVKDMSFMYDGCKSLKTIPNFSNNATDLSCVCANCSNLESLPEIPGSARNCDSIALNCEKLTGPIVVNEGVYNLACGFAGCTSLDDKIDLPTSVKITTDMYANCTQFEVEDDELDDVTYDLSDDNALKHDDFVKHYNDLTNQQANAKATVATKSNNLTSAEKQAMAAAVLGNNGVSLSNEMGMSK